MVYTCDGKAAAYRDISVPLFVQGYLITMDSQDSSIKDRMAEHLKNLMYDIEMYGWEIIRAFHGVWRNQIEQGHCTWLDDDQKLSSTGPWFGIHPLLTPRAGGHQNLSEDRPVQGSLQCLSQAQHQDLQGLQPGKVQQGHHSC